MLLLLVGLASLAAAICAGLAWLGSRRSDQDLMGMAQLYRQFGLPNPALLRDWPQRHFWANRRELEAIARYHVRQRA